VARQTIIVRLGEDWQMVCNEEDNNEDRNFPHMFEPLNPRHIYIFIRLVVILVCAQLLFKYASHLSIFLFPATQF